MRSVSPLYSKTLVFDETLAPGSKPLQVYATDEHVRSIHGASYTRLFSVTAYTVPETGISITLHSKRTAGGRAFSTENAIKVTCSNCRTDVEMGRHDGVPFERGSYTEELKCEFK